MRPVVFAVATAEDIVLPKDVVDGFYAKTWRLESTRVVVEADWFTLEILAKDLLCALE